MSLKATQDRLDAMRYRVRGLFLEQRALGGYDAYRVFNAYSQIEIDNIKDGVSKFIDAYLDGRYEVREKIGDAPDAGTV